ncbi:MAG TPA: SDR family NAD(P)-dependent oxidoreductase [Polyangiaceae bacterium]|nr:SDR family NAD(P)-dependent oxidoreductase [Polyangiaceae bacterium]
MPHPALSAGRVAVITGAANGIGLAAARRFRSFGMKVALADNDAAELEAVTRELGTRGDSDVIGVPTDVSRLADLERLRELTWERLGPVSVLVNNAGTGLGAGPWERYDEWKRVLDVNLWGVINGVHAFIPRMLEHGLDGLVINTGSKQGITCPPGNTAYNVSKAGVKVFTESLQHQLRNTAGCRLSAYLLVPGWTDTAINRKAVRDRARLNGDSAAPLAASGPRPAGAWTSDQVIDYLLASIEKGKFYILCPDNDVSEALDRKRIAWAAGDLIEGRPPLSRWHSDFAAQFKKFSES